MVLFWGIVCCGGGIPMPMPVFIRCSENHYGSILLDLHSISPHTPFRSSWQVCLSSPGYELDCGQRLELRQTIPQVDYMNCLVFIHICTTLQCNSGSTFNNSTIPITSPSSSKTHFGLKAPQKVTGL